MLSVLLVVVAVVVSVIASLYCIAKPGTTNIGELGMSFSIVR